MRPPPHPREGGRGMGTQNCVDQKQPKSVFPSVNFIFSRYEIWVQGGGGGLLLRLSAVLIHPGSRPRTQPAHTAHARAPPPPPHTHDYKHSNKHKRQPFLRAAA